MSCLGVLQFLKPLLCTLDPLFKFLIRSDNKSLEESVVGQEVHYELVGDMVEDALKEVRHAVDGTLPCAFASRDGKKQEGKREVVFEEGIPGKRIGTDSKSDALADLVA